MEAVEKRRHVIINIIYAGMILGLLYLFLKYALGLLMPFLAAFLVAAILQRPINFLMRKTPLKKGFLSVTLVLLIAAVLVTLLILTGARIVAKFQDLTEWVVSRFQSLPEVLDALRDKLLGVTAHLPSGLRQSAQEGINNLFQNADSSAEAVVEQAEGIVPGTAPTFGGIFSKLDLSMLSKPISGIWNTAKQIPSILIGVIISIIAACFMTTGYDDIANFIKRQLSPEKSRALSVSKEIFFSSILKLIKSYTLIICITFAEMFVGLMVLKLIGVYTSGHEAVVAIAVAVIDIFPVLGTGTVLFPWAAIAFITGKVGLGIGLLVLYAVISVIRQIIEPKLVASNLGLPPVVTLMSMYIGLQLFSVLGIFIMPILVTMVKLLNDRGILHIWKRVDQQEEPQMPELTEEMSEEAVQTKA